MLNTSERAGFDARFAALFAVNPRTVIAENARHAYSIDKVGVGGVLKIAGESFVVQKTATYTEVNEKRSKDLDYTVTELTLFSLKTGQFRYIEWSLDDELDISFTERKLSTAEMNRELRHDNGDPFDVDEDIDECIGVRFNGVEYAYDDDWECRFEASDGRKHQATIYDFGSDEIGWLTIEAWQNGKEWEYEGYLSITLRSGAIEIISTGTSS